MSDKRRAKFEAIRSSPSFIAGVERAKRAAQREAPAFAFVVKALPDGVVAIVRLNESGNVQRYAIVSESTCNDDVIGRIRLAVLSHDRAYPDDDSPVSITIYADGRTVTQSERYGQSDRTIQSARRATTTRTTALLTKAAGGQPKRVRDYGTARFAAIE